MDNNNNNNNNNNNKNNKNNKITLKPREINDLSSNIFNLPPIDNSFNKIFRTWKINPVLNHNLFPLEPCKENKFIFSKNSKDIIKKQLNINRRK